MARNTITLNVGGITFATDEQTLNGTSIPHDDYINFIDRDPVTFEYILNFLRGYNMILPDDKHKLLMLYDDSVYYQIPALTKHVRDKIIHHYPHVYDIYNENELSNMLKCNDLSKQEMVVKLQEKHKHDVRNSFMESTGNLLAIMQNPNNISPPKMNTYNRLLMHIYDVHLKDRVDDSVIKLVHMLIKDYIESQSQDADIDEIYNDVISDLTTKKEATSNNKGSEEMPVSLNDLMMQMFAGSGNQNDPLINSLRDVTSVLTQKLSETKSIKEDSVD